MAELSGILDGVGLPAITRFLTGLNKTGSLELTEQDWHGQIFFQDGTIAAARLGSRTGVEALEAIVELFPSAQFVFDSNARPTGEPAIGLSQAELLERMDAIASHAAAGTGQLPPADLVPAVVPESASGADEPVPLDRGTLQTLLAVDGQRSVREIVRQRNTFDALWQLRQLAEVGLADLGPNWRRANATPEGAAQAAPTAQTGAQATAPTPPQPAARPTPQPATQVPAPDPVQPPASAVSQAASGEQAGAPQVSGRCPSLGFEDDASSSFARPTRLHRCFAANTPLPLSLDQQRELCLTDHFGTCPRLTQGTPAASGASPAQPSSSGPSGRIVRLPTLGRQPAADRSEAAEPTVASSPRPFRAVAAARASAAAAGETQAQARPAPTPLRARLQRTPAASATAAVAEPPAPINPERRSPPPGATARQPAPPEAPADEARSRVRAALPLSLGSGRVVPMLGVGLAIVLIAALTYFLAPQIMSVVGGDSVDTSNLPNARLAEEGTPVSGAPAAQPTAAAQGQPSDQAPADVTATGQAQPAVAGVQTASDPQATPVSPNSAQAALPSAPLLEEKFVGNNGNWPSDPQGVAQLSNGSYRIGTRQAGQFVAIGAPMANVPSDVVVNATLQKLGGPPGGGYGIILRNQDPTSLDGNNQNGHYYVLEAGDKGEVGIWRRDGDHWVDLLPWQHSDAVKTGSAPNDLSARAVGNTLSLSVNGTTVATRTDATFSSGAAGLFVGGDGNQVAVSHFAIQNP